tara:strand:- start:143 stop:319 length:177 start_codon:yes stop_codon:yes gene_type:complete
MKWEVKKVRKGSDKNKWGIFLKKEYCKTTAEVCYGVSLNKKCAEFLVNRMNNDDYWVE